MGFLAVKVSESYVPFPYGVKSFVITIFALWFIFHVLGLVKSVSASSLQKIRTETGDLHGIIYKSDGSFIIKPFVRFKELNIGKSIWKSLIPDSVSDGKDAQYNKETIRDRKEQPER